jgi:hypothetical protein
MESYRNGWVSLKARWRRLSHSHGLSGRQYMVRDGVVAVAEEDAPPLLRTGFAPA